MSNQKRDYDGTVARIAGNIAAGLLPMPCPSPGPASPWTPETLAQTAVHLARAIVAEVKRTEPPSTYVLGQAAPVVD